MINNVIFQAGYPHIIKMGRPAGTRHEKSILLPVYSGAPLKRQVTQRRKPGKNNDFRSTETMNENTPVNDNSITMRFRHLNLKHIRNVNHKFKKMPHNKIIIYNNKQAQH
ncbi:TPA: hypothetical protein ACWV6N_004383 [Salmonella enterica subsp. enterica serovar Muenchen]